MAAPRRFPAGPSGSKRSGMLRWCLEQCKELLAAVHFLSILSIPGSARLFHTDETEPRLIVGSAYFPLVGLVIGAIASLFTLLMFSLPILLLSALLVVVLVVLTGGLHLDGLMDACDGLFGGKDRERKLEIMRDSRVGSFGVLGGACVLLLKFACFASFPAVGHLALALLIVPPVARWAVILAMYLFPAARSTGLGAAARQAISRPRLLIAGALALLIALTVGWLAGCFVWLLASLTALLMGYWTTRALGGLTGDIYGAIIETTEVVCFFLLVLVHF